MARVALDGTRLGTADGLSRPGTWLDDLAFLILSAALGARR
jgi:hypothetical protein